MAAERPARPCVLIWLSDWCQLLQALVPPPPASGKAEEPELTSEAMQRMREATPGWIKTHFHDGWLSDRNATSQHLAAFLGWQSENFDFVQLTRWSLQHHAAPLCDSHC